MKEATAIILAGGQSSRMGTNKALLTIDGKTVIEKIVGECKKITSQQLIVTNTFSDYAFLDLPMVADRLKGKGPLAGFQAGLSAVTTQKNLIVACDMPFISAQVGSELLTDLTEYDVVIPKIAGQLHPLFAAYRKSCLEHINKSLDDGILQIRHFFKEVNVKIKTEKDFKNFTTSAFFNMNYPQEYEKATKLAKQDKEGRD